MLKFHQGFKRADGPATNMSTEYVHLRATPHRTGGGQGWAQGLDGMLAHGPEPALRAGPRL